MKKVSLIIPCYNEEQALPIFAGELDKVRQELRQYDFEVLMVNDGSSDKTLETMKKISEEYDYFKYLSFSRNFGKEAAMYAGFCNADGDYVAVMDADMQDPPSLLPEMLGILEQGEYDSVATRRVTRKGEPPIRSWFARMFYKIINKISDSDVVDGARDFRLMKAEMDWLLFHLHGNQDGNRRGPSRTWDHATISHCKYGQPRDSSVSCPDLCAPFWYRICLACGAGGMACKLPDLLYGSQKVVAG